jgi:O-antigen/teichoic acid export membrane protein
MNIPRLKKYFRFSPFDQTTLSGRSDERYRLAMFASIANILSRAFSMLVMILSVSLTLDYLGTERFGIWMTIASLVGALSFLDLGMGNSLTNRVAEAANRVDKNLLRSAISGGMMLLLFAAIFVAIILNCIYFLFPWNDIFKSQWSASSSEISNAMFVFIWLFSALTFTTGAQKVFFGLQRGYEAHIAAIIGSICSLLGLYFVSQMRAPISYLLISMMGGAILANALLIGLLLFRGLLVLADMPRNFVVEAKKIIRPSGLFFLLQIGTMAAWGADNLIISSTLGAASVAVFSITQRLFLISSQPIGIVNASLWPAFADASSSGDKDFIRKTLFRSLLFTFVCSSLLLVLVLLTSDYLIDKWTSGAIVVPFTFLVVYAAWSLIESFANSFAMFMNGCGIMKPQLFGLITLLLISIPLKLVLIDSFGLIGMQLGFLIFFVLNILFWYGIVFRKSIAKSLY